MLLTILSLSISLIATVTFIVTSLKKGGKWGLATKVIASACFVVSGLIAVCTLPNVSSGDSTSPTWAWFIFTGLVLGMVGDIFMDMKEQEFKSKDVHFISGMMSFAIGHFMYYAGLTLHADIRCNILIPIAIALVLGLLITSLIFVNSGSLGIKWGNFKWHSFGYSLVLTTMFVYSIIIAIFDKTTWLFAVAMTMFLISDLILSLIYFAYKKSNTMRTLNWSTYYLAQNLIVLFLFLI